MSEPFQALAFGASGITGHAILTQAVEYPTPTTFGRIIGLTNRPLNKSDAYLPDDSRIELYSDLDLTSAEGTFSRLSSIRDIEKTTHVYFAAYTGHGQSYEELKRANTEILTNALDALEKCCPKMKFFTLQTGGKAYGVEFADKPDVSYNPPLREDMPRIPEPWAGNIFYYDQYDIVKRTSEGKSWSFCEIRPDAVVGFVPSSNAMNIAQGLGIFLSLYKEINGEGAEVAFPGGKEAWEALHTDTSQDILAKFHLFSSMHPDKTADKAFNVIDQREVTWAQVWPEICGYFDLRGVAPKKEYSVEKWVQEHKDAVADFVLKYGLKKDTIQNTGFDFADVIVGIPFRRDYDNSRARSIGFNEERPHAEGYKMVFDQMQKAQILPSP